MLKEIIWNLQQNSCNSELVQQAFDNDLIIEPGLSFEKSDNLSKVFRYLLNIRVICLILTNIFWNQIKLLIRSRVVFDRDLFNYEEYRQRGMTDNRLVKLTLFQPTSKGAKVLVSEFFKFHLKEQMVDIDILTSSQLIHNLNILASHVEGLHFVESQIDIEPILLVFFQKLSVSKNSKDALSKVSK